MDSTRAPHRLTPKDAALHYGVDEKTVRRWINEGRLPAKRRGGPRGRLFIDPADLDNVYEDTA